MTVYFDMDRVLCDFATQADRYRILKKNSCVNWLKVFLIGSKFWSEMEFFPGTNEYFFKVREYCIKRKVDVKILSSVRLLSGRLGKMKWCRRNLCLGKKDVILVNRAEKKALFASHFSLLIDDNEKNVNGFIRNGGHGYKFVSWNDECYKEIIKTIDFVCNGECV